MTPRYHLCFTGHRPVKLGGYNDQTNFHSVLYPVLYQTLERFYNVSMRTCVSGMALGWDTWAAEAVLQLKSIHPDVRLIAAVPFLTQPLIWPLESQIRWRNIVQQADEIWLTDRDEQITFSELMVRLNEAAAQEQKEPNAPALLNARNTWMVERSKRVLSCWDGTRGGTGNCVAVARKLERTLYNLDPLTHRVSVI
jgi:uncharacterized phage-like protein YoqJ